MIDWLLLSVQRAVFPQYSGREQVQQCIKFKWKRDTLKVTLFMSSPRVTLIYEICKYNSFRWWCGCIFNSKKNENGFILTNWAFQALLWNQIESFYSSIRYSRLIVSRSKAPSLEVNWIGIFKQDTPCVRIIRTFKKDMKWIFSICTTPTTRIWHNDWKVIIKKRNKASPLDNYHV